MDVSLNSLTFFAPKQSHWFFLHFYGSLIGIAFCISGPCYPGKWVGCFSSHCFIPTLSCAYSLLSLYCFGCYIVNYTDIFRASHYEFRRGFRGKLYGISVGSLSVNDFVI